MRAHDRGSGPVLTAVCQIGANRIGGDAPELVDQTHVQISAMKDSEKSYVYSPLLGPRSIRVLVIQPAPRRVDPLQCSFLEVSLDDNVSPENEYEAISYTWGVPDATKPVLCDGRTVMVTPNCQQAILHLRRSLQPRRIWIDAVCIDQQSVSEKNTQVPMMGDIYHRAQRTIIWLGPDIDGVLSGVLRRASRYGGYINRFILKPGLEIGDATDETRPKRSHMRLGILGRNESQRMAHLLSEDWFRRIWTIQEFLLSKSTVFRMGKVECSSNNLLRYFEIGHGLLSRPDLRHFTMRNDLSEFRLISSVDSDHFYNFITLLVKLMALNDCADARDKIYGIMAYIKRAYPSFQLPVVDYGKSLVEIYESFTRSIITATGTLWALEFIKLTPRIQRPGHNAGDEISIPSWVLDLRDPLHVSYPGWYHKSAKTSDVLFQTDTPGRLRVRGKEIGRVLRVGLRMPHWDPALGNGFDDQGMDAARAECLSQWTTFAANLDLEDDLVATSPYRFLQEKKRGRHYSSRINANPCHDPHVRAIRFLASVLDPLRQPHGLGDTGYGISGNKPWPQASQGLVTQTLRAVERRWERSDNIIPDVATRHIHDGHVLFLTSEGYFGQCDGDVQVGDKMCSLEGAAMVFVLRESEEAGEFLVASELSSATNSSSPSSPTHGDEFAASWIQQLIIAPKELPRFWVFLYLYRVSPLTYFINGLLAAGIADTSITCSAVELLRITPVLSPPVRKFGEYMAPYMQIAGGYLANPEAVEECLYCQALVTNTVLRSIGLDDQLRNAWRDVGFLAAVSRRSSGMA
ncbi:heterokaryon incompatibility protein-domain-containing protein [Cercophora newfieldiana]|uniref:Heterokaryon incompatibility protein-domain-containing protein n=1 Tax=Cercophora newfieldiana TaxID=92897 RepID=A0AA40D019_9PEZI|nr:heterokaryon incompatibility protein-domain-containing protein [Cercophora newfieldiana]